MTYMTYEEAIESVLKRGGTFECARKLLDCATKGIIEVHHTSLEEYLDFKNPMKCPKTGAFIGYKKCLHGSEVCVLTLGIPKHASRSSAYGNKCRCSEAEVLYIETLDGRRVLEAKSNYDPSFVYRVGETVKANNFDICRWHECASGIHFFMTKEEARNYEFQ